MVKQKQTKQSKAKTKKTKQNNTKTFNEDESLMLSFHCWNAMLQCCNKIQVETNENS